MKIIVIGGNGTLGSAVVNELKSRHSIIVASHSSSDLKCDISSERSIRQFFERVGKFDAVAITAGNVHFEDFSQLTADKFQIGLNHKLMGQVNVVRIGSEFINDKGSFTLISGVLAYDPIHAGVSASMVNGAINSFVIAAAIEMPKSIRINAVCPTVFTESMDKYGPYFRGYKPVPVASAALAYSKSIEGLQTGQVYRVE